MSDKTTLTLLVTKAVSDKTTLPPLIAKDQRFHSTYFKEPKEEVKSKVYAYFVMVHEGKLVIALSVSSSPRNHHSLDPFGGFPDYPNDLQKSLMEEIDQETCRAFGDDIAHVDKNDERVYREDFFQKYPSVVNEFEKEIKSNFHGMKSKFKGVDAVVLITPDDYNKIVEHQLTYINYHDSHKDQKIISKHFLEKRGTALYPFSDFITLLKKAREENFSDRAELFLEPINEIPEPDDPTRMLELKEFKEKSKNTYKIPGYVVNFMKDKIEFFENAVKKLGLEQYV